VLIIQFQFDCCILHLLTCLRIMLKFASFCETPPPSDSCNFRMFLYSAFPHTTKLNCELAAVVFQSLSSFVVMTDVIKAYSSR